MTEVEHVHDATTQPVTSSMVTVRLSDVQIHPEVEDSADPNETFSTRSASIISKTSSASSGSHNETMSMESVDWEGLEKTEKQERCEEGTDEVCRHILSGYTTMLTHTGNCITPRTTSSKRMLPSSTIPRLISGAGLGVVPGRRPCNNSRNSSTAHSASLFDTP